MILVLCSRVTTIAPSVGKYHLQLIYNLIENNRDWIYSSLDIREQGGDNSDPLSSNTVNFVSDVSSRRDREYEELKNPLKLYRRIGFSDIDFVSAIQCIHQSLSSCVHWD